VSLACLAVFTQLMFVSRHDAVLVVVLLLSALGAALGAALALARSPAQAVDRLRLGAELLAEGDLEVRVGSVGGGPELESLAGAFDEMAGRLRSALERERTAEAQRRDLITAVSHDLRTPLAGLRAMVEAIDDGVVSDETSLRRYAAEMRRTVRSVSELVDDLFELVQLDAGAIAAESERVRLDDVVSSAVAACRAQALGKRVLVETTLGDAGRALCSPRLTRVLQNLLQNAIHHTPTEGCVTLWARSAPTGLRVAVSDTGPGLSAVEAGRAFEPFWRGDPSRSTGGAGLGLAMSKRIVEALGGEIRVAAAPAPAQGARFDVLLPASTG
ncbi:MAG: HAMP domain-containing sensor histidine kinase, partial [Actinomycetota bacterium]